VPEEGTQRRLAAILASDVAGYSWLMEADEAGTLSSLERDEVRLNRFGIPKAVRF